MSAAKAVVLIAAGLLLTAGMSAASCGWMRRLSSIS